MIGTYDIEYNGYIEYNNDYYNEYYDDNIKSKCENVNHQPHTKNNSTDNDDWGFFVTLDVDENKPYNYYKNVTFIETPMYKTKRHNKIEKPHTNNLIELCNFSVLYQKLSMYFQQRHKTKNKDISGNIFYKNYGSFAFVCSAVLFVTNLFTENSKQ